MGFGRGGWSEIEAKLEARHRRSERSSLVNLVRERADLEPDRHAFTLLAYGGGAETWLTFADVDRRARAVAAYLQEAGAAGERALLLHAQDLDFIAALFGCLYAGVTAVPAFAPRLNRDDPRLSAITRDAGAAFALTSDSIAAASRDSTRLSSDLAGVRWIATDSVPDEMASCWKEPEITGDTLAYLQYTSGATSEPKGVMVTHSNVLANLEYIRKALEFTPDSVMLTWLPFFHDMGLVGGILEPVYAGCSSYFMPPVAFLQRPIRWLQAVSDQGATHSGGPNFAFDLCVQKITEEQREPLDLSGWTAAYCGAEPVRSETLHRFTETFASQGFRGRAFYPCYGLAESVLMVTGGRVADEPVRFATDAPALERDQVLEADPSSSTARDIVGNGQTYLDTRVEIVRPDSRTRCGPVEIGEVWVSGPSVARGYWERPAESAETFGARLEDTDTGPFLRTGDLGFIRDGELFVTGRLKDLIIIRGRNHYPQDIEATLACSHPALASGTGVAFSVEVDDEERLVVVQEVRRRFRRNLDVEGVAQSVRQAIAIDHGLQTYCVVLVPPATISRTSSGKVQRRLCCTQFLGMTLGKLGESRIDGDYVQAGARLSGTVPLADSTDLAAVEPALRREWIESYLNAQICRALGVPATELGFDRPLGSLGLDSLMTAELRALLESTTRVSLPMEWLLDGARIGDVATMLLEQYRPFDATARLPAPNECPEGGPVSQSAPPTSWSLLQRTIRRFGRMFIRLLAHLDLEGEDNLTATGPAVLIYNHLHIVDGLLLLTLLPRPAVFLVADGWRHWPIVSWMLKNAYGAIYIRRGHGDLDAIERGSAVLRSGGIVTIAPEGGISYTGGLRQGHSGLAHVAMRSGAPLVPFAMYGQQDGFKRWFKLQRVPIHVRIGTPIAPPPPRSDQLRIDEYTRSSMVALARMMPEEFRGVYGNASQDSQGD